MKISLRKANALQALINGQINEAFNGTLTITKYDNLSDKLDEANLLLAETIQKKFELIQVLYSVRRKVGAASSTVGIADLLTELAEIEKKSAFAKQLGSATQYALTKEQLATIFADILTQKDQYGRTKDAVTVNLLTKAEVESYKLSISTFRKAKQAVSDKLLHLNVSTEIELGEIEVVVLKQYDII